MTHDDHQRERMRAWALFCASMMPRPAPHPERDADSMLAEFDKRFPAPSAAAPVEPAVEIANVYDSIDGRVPVIDAAELASLRQKSRLWDAVASGKLGIYPRDGDFAVHWDIGYSIRPTAAEAVESAIAQGAFK